jgi:hypothetical protein
MSRTQRSQLAFEERTFEMDPSLLVWFEEVGGVVHLVVADATPTASDHTLAGLRKAAEMRGHDARR